MPQIGMPAHDRRNDGRPAGTGHERQLDAFLLGDALHGVAVIRALEHIREALAFLLGPSEGLLQRLPRAIRKADDPALVQPEQGEELKIPEPVLGADEVGGIGERRGRGNAKRVAIRRGGRQLGGHDTAVRAAGDIADQHGLPEAGL